jgi:A/G-specific adenine glycosylase
VQRDATCVRSPRSAPAGYPDTGDLRRKQAAYEGSDRQARGAVLHALRAAPSCADDVVADSAQRDRAIDSLIVDGLVEVVDGNLRLPQ